MTMVVIMMMVMRHKNTKLLKQSKKYSSKSNSCLVKRGKNSESMFYWNPKAKKCKYKKESNKNNKNK